MGRLPDALVRSVAEVSRQLLELDPEGLDAGIEAALCTLGAGSDADRVVFRLYTPDAGTIESSHEWMAEGVPPRKTSLVQDERERMRWGLERLREGRELQLTLSSQEPEAEPLLEEMRRRDMKALLILPGRVSSSLGLLRLEMVRDERRWSEDEVTLLRMAAEILIGAVSRKRAERALRVSELRFRALAEHAVELITEIDAGGICLYLSPSFRELLGHDPAQLAGTPARDLIHPDDFPDARDRFAVAIDEAGISRSTHRLRHADGSWRWFEATGRAYFNADGERRFVSIGRDITARLRIEEELRRSELLLEQSRKMEALGRLAGGVAHDFNSLLMVIMGNAELLGRDLESAGARPELEEILAAVARGAGLTRQLLAFGRTDIQQTTRLDLERVFSRLESLLRRLLGDEVQLHFEPAGEPCVIAASASQLEQIILNLTVNARDAMPAGGGLLVALRVEQVRAEQANKLGLSGPASYVVLSMSDSGTGMDTEQLVRIFEPFFTTKQPGQGTGLGLSIVYGVVRQLGGAIDVLSEPGIGTLVRVFLPRVEAAAADDEPADSADAPAGGHETVLVVEDEPAARRLLTEMLERAGYRVLEAADGVEALELAEKWDAPIELLVSDVVMPRMRGLELAARLRERRPDLRVLYVTGHADDPRIFSTPGAPPLLSKPFSHAQLRARVRQILDAPAPGRAQQAG